ncbi:sugar ABC transporter permease [Flexivirga endophytica]|uniref:Autoinducer 2 import system permease protein LsrC n=1 Tax=Flexivirga endophytica TaxID=1849103 RepID=A0A916T5W8_9MICO|nr:ABC transporter permease [Flexivirga endophytica]GGB29878.1 sugar ABC transporter permease [Flexivirga endophytica]GHB50838.1 sugar ABC transporter permease [Flexivirga endophytica]
MTTTETAPKAPVPALTQATAAGRLDALLRAREIGLALAIVVLIALTTAKNTHFLSADSIQQILNGGALIGLMAVGETLVIVTRNVDLSIGSTLGLSAYIVGDLFVHDAIDIWMGFVVGIAIGAVIGLINGLITVVFRVPSLVVTLAMLYAIRGIDGVIVDGKQINASSIPGGYTAIGYQTVLGVPWLFIVVAIIVAIAGYAMRTFRSSRELYAIGSSPQAATLAGIPAARRVLVAFLISGALAGLAGALFLAEYAQVNNNSGTGYELTVVSAVVVGGVAIFGGSGTVFGAALGALLLNTINLALVAARISASWNQAIAGALLLAAIAFDRWLSQRVTRKLRKTEGAHRDI